MLGGPALRSASNRQNRRKIVTWSYSGNSNRWHMDTWMCRIRVWTFISALYAVFDDVLGPCRARYHNFRFPAQAESVASRCSGSKHTNDSLSAIETDFSCWIEDQALVTRSLRSLQTYLDITFLWRRSPRTLRERVSISSSWSNVVWSWTLPPPSNRRRTGNATSIWQPCWLSRPTWTMWTSGGYRTISSPAESTNYRTDRRTKFLREAKKFTVLAKLEKPSQSICVHISSVTSEPFA